MNLKVSGEQTRASNAQLSFAGCRIEAQFSRKPEPAQDERPPNRLHLLGLNTASANLIERDGIRDSSKPTHANALLSKLTPVRVSVLHGVSGTFHSSFQRVTKLMATRRMLRKLTTSVSCVMSQAVCDRDGNHLKN